MYQLASCCLLFIGFLNPLLSPPVLGSRDASLQLPAPEEDARSALQALGRASVLQLLRGVPGAAEPGDGLREADPNTNTENPRGHLRKAISAQDSKTLLSQLLNRTRKQHKQHGPPLECFWKYCV